MKDIFHYSKRSHSRLTSHTWSLTLQIGARGPAIPQPARSESPAVLMGLPVRAHRPSSCSGSFPRGQATVRPVLNSMELVSGLTHSCPIHLPSVKLFRKQPSSAENRFSSPPPCGHGGAGQLDANKHFRTPKTPVASVPFSAFL